MTAAADDLVVLRTFLNVIDAELAKSVLDAADLPSLIRADDAGGMGHGGRGIGRHGAGGADRGGTRREAARRNRSGTRREATWWDCGGACVEAGCR